MCIRDRILGIAGISGCGQKELLEAIAGLQVTEAGTISYVEDDGSKEMLIGKDPLKIAEMGVSLSFVPEDRLGMGLVGNMDLTDNMMLRSFRQGHTPFTNRKPSKQLATDVVENLDDNLLNMGKGTSGSKVGTGGMATKLTAAQINKSSAFFRTSFYQFSIVGSKNHCLKAIKQSVSTLNRNAVQFYFFIPYIFTAH